MELMIDLDDGLPAAKVDTIKKPKVSETKPLRFVEAMTIQVTSIPVAVVISYAPVSCLGCGAEHRDHRGIFVEHKLSNRVTRLERINLRDIQPYVELPRRVDIAPREVIPICSDCFLIEKLFLDAAALAEAQGELFGSPSVPRVVKEIAKELKKMHETQVEVEIEEEL